jgi:hypothetical protein
VTSFRAPLGALMQQGFDHNKDRTMNAPLRFQSHPATPEILRHLLGNARIPVALRDQVEAILRSPILPASGTAWGAEFTAPLLLAFMPGLRAAAALPNLPAVPVSMSGNQTAKFPAGGAALTAAWVAEGAAVPVKEGALTSRVLTVHKCAAILAATNEVAGKTDFARIAAGELTAALGRAMDTRAFSATAATAGVSGDGLFHANNAASLSATAGGGATAARGDVVAAVAAAATAGATLSPDSTRWCMAPAVLARLVATGAFGNFDGTGPLAGFPVLAVPTMATTAIALVCGAHVLVSIGLPNVSVTESASVHMDDAPADDLDAATTPVRGLWQMDSVGFLGSLLTGWRTTHVAAVQYVPSITW